MHQRMRCLALHLSTVFIVEARASFHQRATVCSASTLLCWVYFRLMPKLVIDCSVFMPLFFFPTVRPRWSAGFFFFVFFVYHFTYVIFMLKLTGSYDCFGIVHIKLLR